MCNAWNHPPGCMCGWGGDGHLGGGGGCGASTLASMLGPVESPKVYYSYGSSLRDLAQELGYSVIFPTYCRYCGALIYLFANPNGGFAIFDSLGGGWPKHECCGITSENRDYTSFSVSYSQNFQLPIPENTIETIPNKKTIQGVVVKKSSSEELTYGEIYYFYDGEHLVKLWSASNLDVGKFIEGLVEFRSGHATIENPQIIQPGELPITAQAPAIGQLSSTKALNSENFWNLQFDIDQLKKHDTTAASLLKIALDALLSGYRLISVIVLSKLVQISSNSVSKELKARHLETLLVLIGELNLHASVPGIEMSLSRATRKAIDQSVYEKLNTMKKLGDLKLKLESRNNRLSNFDSFWRKEEKYAKSLKGNIDVIGMARQFKAILKGS